MAKERSKKSPYPSRYAPNHWVTPAQYVIEFVCEQSAKHQKKDLPLRFWKNNKKWEKFFISQTRSANKILKKYSPKAIINAVKKNKIRSLHPKWVINAVEKEEDILNAQMKSVVSQAMEEMKEEYEEEEKPKERFRKNNFYIGSINVMLDLDKEIEYGEEETQ